MPTLVLGNVAPLEPSKPDPRTTEVETHPLVIDNGRDDSWTETTFVFPPSTPVGEALRQVEASWTSHHSAALPVWVASDDEALAEIVSRSFSRDDHRVLVGQPKGWDEGPDGVKKAVNDAAETARTGS